MRQQHLILLFVAAITLLAGCKEGADKFFSGRPSEMAMVHNRIIGGPPEAMIELLRVPSRFPDPGVAPDDAQIIRTGNPANNYRLYVIRNYRE